VIIIDYNEDESKWKAKGSNVDFFIFYDNVLDSI
jgi:hypothetical protein